MQAPTAVGQINDAEKYIVIVSGKDFTDQISSRFQPSISLVENCVVNIQSAGNQSYKLTISPKQGNSTYLGKAKAIIQYTDGLPPKPRYITFNITFSTSKITVEPDFITVSPNTETQVSPLINDNTTGTGLKLSGIGQVQSGTATPVGNSILFTPQSGEETAYVLYSVKDDQGSTSNGMIYFLSEKSSYPALDTIKFSLLNTQHKFITLPANGFNLTAIPTKGQVVQMHNQVFKYSPLKGSAGQDLFTFSDDTGNKRIVIVQLLSKVGNTTSVRDDKVFTPKNTAVTFDVFANDLSSNFAISGFSPELTRLTGGKFLYNPPSGYSGTKNFTYTVNYGTYQSTGKIAVLVGNYAPQNSIDYNFNTLKNNALAVTYNVPINGYTFKVLNQPHFGVTEIFDNKTTLSDNCNNVNAKATLIYTPDKNYYGADSFDVEYCVPNNTCIVYKLYIKVHNSDQENCPCQGSDCVWSGDMNGDGRVSVSDLLSLGRFIGLSGNTRTEVNLPYRGGQNAEDWQYQQPNGLNIKHIDADGDGVLTSSDTAAISSNYGTVHSFVPEEVLSVKDYSFELIPNATELDSGDLLVLDVVIGTQKKPVTDLFGLVFGLNFSPSMFAVGSLGAEFYKDSWLTDGAPSIQMAKQPKLGTLQAGVVKAGAVVTDEVEGFKPTGASGNGIIGKIYAVVTDEVEGFRSKSKYITRRIDTEGIEMEDIDGEKYKIPDTFVEFKVNKEKKVPVPTDDKLIIYPNPVQDAVQLHFNGKNTIKGYRLYDAMGNIVASMSEVNRQSLVINTSAFSSGMYVVQVVTTQGVITKKIKVVNK